MEKLPATSYIRLVDVWLIFGQLMPFIEEQLAFKLLNQIAKLTVNIQFINSYVLGCFVYNS